MTFSLPLRQPQKTLPLGACRCHRLSDAMPDRVDGALHSGNRTCHARAPGDSFWIAPSGQRGPLPGAPCAESLPRPQASQFRDAAAPSEAPQSAPSGDPETLAKVPCAESPPRPQASQSRDAAAPSEAPQLAPSGDPEASPSVHASLQRTAPPAQCPVGIILFDRDKWAAACAGFELRREGRRSLPGGLPEEAVWIVAGTSLRLAKLRRAKEFKDLSLHASNWFGPWFGEILEDWGLKRCSLIDQAMALSAVADRTVGLAERAAALFARDWDRPAAAPLLEAPSLAEGLRLVVYGEDPESPWDCDEQPEPTALLDDEMNHYGEAAAPWVMDFAAFLEAFQRGGAWAERPGRFRLETRLHGPQPDPVLEDIVRKGGAEATMLAALQGGDAPVRRETPFESHLRLRVPRLEHALDVLARPIPDSDESWECETIGDEPLSKAQFRNLVARELPVLVGARAVPKPGVPHDACIASWGAPPGEERPREEYTLEEVAEMLDTHEFHNPSALIGPDWRSPPEAALLDALVESIGSRRLAHASWSAGLVGAAILDAAMGPTWRRGHANCFEEGKFELVPPSCVWLAARERILARDRLRAMGPAGAVTYSGTRGGCDRLYIWEDSASRAELASAAWEIGLHMQTGPARRLHEAGHPPASRPADWGGGQAAVPLAALSQRGDADRLWKIDQIACLPPAERAALRGTAWADMVEDAPWL